MMTGQQTDNGDGRLETGAAPEGSVIDLGLIATDPKRDTISGRPAGEAARKTLNVSAIVGASPTVRVRVPDHIRVVTPSFFVGLLSPEISELEGVEAARERFELVNASDTTQLNLAHALASMLRRRSPFDNLPVANRRHRGLFKKHATPGG